MYLLINGIQTMLDSDLVEIVSNILSCCDDDAIVGHDDDDDSSTFH